jgi:hypothetical protein
VAKFSLRRYEDQALFSVVLGIVACLSLITQALMTFRNVNWAEKVILYGNPTRKYLILLAALITLGLGLGAVGFGFNSAGQRRNDRPQFSWIGFFLGAGAICLTIVLVFIFQTRSEFLAIGR